MKRMAAVIAIALLATACGGTADSDAEPSSDGGISSGLPDPCTLVNAEVLDSYFTQAVEPERGSVGPLVTCRWVDDDADSLLIQVRAGTEVHRFEDCDQCSDLTFADDGFAWTSPAQSGADFVVDGTWHSVTTTGMGDDLDSIAALAETVYEVAYG